MKGLFMRYLYVKCQNPNPLGSKDTAQVKGFSLRFEADTDADIRVMTISLQTVIPAS
jgi:hypothetical protein